MTPARSHYTTVAIGLHWLIAAAILFQIILGWRMGDLPKGPVTYAIFQLHKSIGISILLLSLARLAWRLMNAPPLPPSRQPAWERIASQVVHWGFYVIMIGLPVTGWIMVSASRTNIPTLLYGTVPWPHLPILPELAEGAKHAWRSAGELGHGLLVKLTYGLLALHLGAVAKHQILDRDEVFRHMAPGAKPGFLEPRAWLAALTVVGVVSAGYFYQPPVPKPALVFRPLALAPPLFANVAPLATTTVPQPVTKTAVPWSLNNGGVLEFSTSWSGQPIVGRFTTWTADIVFSPEALAGSRLVVSVDLASATTGDAQRDATLPTDDWFAAAAHPKAIFTSVHIRKLAADRFIADGTLDLKGVKRPASVPFTLQILGNTASAQGTLILDRTSFGIGQGEWAATDQIPAKVQVTFNLRAKRKA